MGMTNVASRYTSQAFAAGSLTLTVAANEPVTVYGIWLSNQAGGIKAFDIQNGSGVTIQVVELEDGTTAELGTCWKAYAGLRIVGVADTSATVFHGNPGN